MMEPYAVVDDLQARWRALTAAERPRAAALLEDATALIAAALARAGKDPQASTEVEEANRRAVCCAMVRRAMEVPAGYAGVSQATQTAGPYTFSASYANPAANLYLTSGDRKALGAGRMRLGSLRPRIGGESDDSR